ncbi:MAG TPA: RluA family pseudouridine synthase [Edaphobacter sp.]|nr:RluA family pseudouridine synthase [Edaphobacter sp.]
MPSKHMLPKGKRRHTVKPLYRATRGLEETPVVVPEIDLEDEHEDGIRSFTADAVAAGMRLDQYLAQAIPEISRARVQMLIENGQVRVEGKVVAAKHKLRGGEAIEIEGTPQPPPLHAIPEDIPLDVLHEDQHLAVINKPAGMTVHAGSGASEDARNRGTLVNALLFHFQQLSDIGGELRPGIVHRLDKQTSGIIVVAKDDITHRKLSEMFAGRHIAKTYIALVHGNLTQDETTVDLPIARDLVRRTRMTTRRAEGRSAVSHVKVLERIQSFYGRFTLVEVRIETGRTHQIRVHMQALGHPVVGDSLYGAPHRIGDAEYGLSLERNFLHAAHLVFEHPQSGKTIDIKAALPPELQSFLAVIRAGSSGVE